MRIAAVNVGIILPAYDCIIVGDSYVFFFFVFRDSRLYRLIVSGVYRIGEGISDPQKNVKRLFRQCYLFQRRQPGKSGAESFSYRIVGKDLYLFKRNAPVKIRRRCVFKQSFLVADLRHNSFLQRGASGERCSVFPDGAGKIVYFLKEPASNERAGHFGNAVTKGQLLYRRTSGKR